MSDTKPQPEPPREDEPTTESSESGKFYVVVGGSGEEGLPPATDSEGLEPESDRLPQVEAVPDDEPNPGAIEDSGKLELYDELAASNEVEPNPGAVEDSGKLELYDELAASNEVEPNPGAVEDSGKLELYDELAASSESEPEPTIEDSGKLELDDRLRKFGEGDPDATHDPDGELTPVSELEFASDVSEIEASDAGLLASSGSGHDAGLTSSVELLDEHPDAEGESPFKPLEPSEERPRPPARPVVVPLRHGRRRDEFFNGPTDYQRQEEPAGEGAAEEASSPDPNAVGGPLQPVDPSALPAYVLEQMEERARQRAQAELDYQRAYRARVGRIGVAIALAFVVGGQAHGWLSLLGSKGLLLLPWDALLGALSGILLTRDPNAIRGQVYIGGAAALAMGTKFGWAVPTGSLEGLSLLITFVCSTGLMFGAIVGGGLLGLSLEQQSVE